MPEPEHRRKKFYIDWGVNPAYIGALLSCLMGVLWWANDVDKDRATTKATLVAHANDDKTIEKRVDKLENQTDDRLARMEAKLDRLIERSKK
jgi:hypothetical protein